ncbi:carbon-nitrogen family hydrolase [Desulfobacterales bacterium HSG17]|nr:carbon-nitrogen family hydrolase [Desulfobacterales bacterium HSG17]
MNSDCMSMDKIKKFKAGFIQFDVKLGMTDENLRTVMNNLDELEEQGVKLAVLPEMWSCGFDNANLKSHALKTPEILDVLSNAALKRNMLIAGSMPEISGDSIFNTLYVTDSDGSIAGSYRKVHLFSLTSEDKYFASGNKNIICRTSLCSLGLMICYDLRFPELSRTLTLKGAELIIIPAQWPQVRISRWDILAQARAIENQVFIIGVNRCGKENSTLFSGHSVIVDPSGEVLQLADNGKACACWAEIDMDKLKQVRTHMPSLKERIPEAYD